MLFVPKNPSKRHLQEALSARSNRLEIVKARSIGQITRRELIKWGLFTAGGALAWKHGLNPVRAQRVRLHPDRACRAARCSAASPFTQPMPRFDVLPRIQNPLTALNPAPTEAGEPHPAVARPRAARRGAPATPGRSKAVRRARSGRTSAGTQFLPQIAIQVTQEGAKNNTAYNPGVPPIHNSNINPATPHSACVSIRASRPSS